ncbi:MAG: hybrid sensor histidine kinase/response regulator [Bacteroidia bacterium]
MMLMQFRTAAQVFDFVSYSVDEGLPQSDAKCILQDSRGFLWVGTAGGGLGVFDGEQFTEYSNKQGFRGQIVSCLAEDSTGQIWIGSTVNGFWKFNGQRFTNYGKEHNIETSAAIVVVALKQTVLVGYSSGIYEYDIDKDVFRTSVKTNDLRSMCYDPVQRCVWVAEKENLYRLENNRLVSVSLPEKMKENGLNIQEIYAAPNGYLYIGCEKGLCIYKPSTNTFSENDLTDQLKGTRVTAICAGSDGSVWIGTNNKLVLRYLGPGNFIQYNVQNGMLSETIYDIIEDRFGKVWFGTREQGLLKLRNEAFTMYNTYPGMSSGTVFRLYEDHAGRIWIGSYADGLYVFENGVSAPVTAGGQTLQQPVAVKEDQSGVIWVGHADGLSQINNRSVTRTFLNGIRVRALEIGKDGHLWIGTYGKGLYEYDGKEFIQYNAEQNQLPMNYIHDIHEDSKGIIWIGTGAGLVRYDRKSFKTYGIKEGPCNSYVGSIKEDREGNIWFHTDACVMRFDGMTFKKYDEQNGLTSNTAFLIEFDQDGILWVGSNKGLDKVQLNPSGNIVAVRNYSRSDGFRGVECNSRAVCRGKDGSLWFGTVKGVIRYNPEKDIQGKIPLRSHVTSIKLFLEPTDWAWTGAEQKGWFNLPQILKLESQQNHLTFSYKAVYLTNPGNVVYKFMLTGFDSIWQPVTKFTEITYSNLPPGNYLFKVIASTDGQNWESIPATSCPIVIARPPPPFWKTIWFAILIILLAGAIAYYFIVIKARKVREQREALEREIRERTQEISRQHEEKTILLKEIHHRVKNNLQVISSLLNLQSENITDPKTLVLFEDLRNRVNSMALIHEKMYQSRNLVNLDIRSYIDDLVRSLIDTYDTNKNIHLHSNIEDHPFHIDTVVPLGLILNEIISNSLKYAFRDRKDGDLYVTLIKADQDHFLLEVADNGVGLSPEFDLKKSSTLGMQLIQMLAEQINGEIEVYRSPGTRYRITFREEKRERI